MENNLVYTSDEISIIIAAGGINRFEEFENFTNQVGALFIPNLVITGSITLPQNFGGTRKDITFSNCTFIDEISIHQPPHIEALHFKGCKFEKSAFFHPLKATLTFSENCHFKSEVTIYGNGNTICYIKNIIIDDLFTIQGSFPNHFSISNINHRNDLPSKGRLEFSHVHFKNIEANNIILKSISCDKKPIFEKAIFKSINVKELNVSTAKGSGLIHIMDSTVDKIYLLSCKGAIVIGKCNINECSVYVDKSAISEINSSIINRLILDGPIEKESIFNLVDSNVSDLEFQSVTNEGVLTLTGVNIPVNGRLCIQNSNLGKADFVNCKFSQAILDFQNSKIAEIFIAETDFPLIVKVNGELNHAQAQLAFGQLHTLLQKQGDTVRALEYQAREIEAHYKILKQKSYVVSNFGRLYNKMLFPISKLSSNKLLNTISNKIWPEIRLIANIFSLWLNNISNKFGRSWQRGVLFSLGIGVLFFYFLVLCSTEYRFAFAIDINGALIKSYLKFMNPIRFFELEYLFKDKNNPNNTYLTLDSTWCFVWDFLGRVFVAYGYYQTIQAFRRFGRK